MRIGLVSPYSLTVPGGVQAQVLGLAREMRRRGHEARVLGPCDGPPPETFVTPLGNSIPTAANGSVAPLAPDPSAALRTIRALRDESFEIVHVHEPLVPGPTMTSVFMHPAPMVGTFHAAGGSAAYRWLNPGVRWLARRLEVRCAVSPDARAMAEQALGGTYELLFNGIEIDRFALAEPTKSDEPAVFFIGRHEPRKGLEVLLDAMAELPASVKLWVAGDGPDTGALQAKVAGDPRIEWLGRVSDTEKAARMRGATVFCAPSLRGESFGVVLLEAMAAGCAVVASDLAGYRNVATDEKDALLVTPGDAGLLATAIRRVIDDSELAHRLRDAGRERAEAFSMASLTDCYLAIYNRLADAAPVVSRRRRLIG
jgi:phosphatidylinositol alpha-mannosyltransferase